MASLSACGNLGKRKKGKNLPDKNGKTQNHVFFKRQKDASCQLLKCSPVKFRHKAARTLLAHALKIAPEKRDFRGWRENRGAGKDSSEIKPCGWDSLCWPVEAPTSARWLFRVGWGAPQPLRGPYGRYSKGFRPGQASLRHGDGPSGAPRPSGYARQGTRNSYEWFQELRNGL